MDGRRKLYFFRDLYNHPATETIFLHAVRKNVEFHRRHNRAYRAILEGKGFSPAGLRTSEELCQLPFIPTLYFKRHHFWTMSPDRLAAKATSSGTGGRKSSIGFDAGALFYGVVQGIRIGRYHGLFSLKPANYLMLGYQPHPSNQTMIVKTQKLSTCYAPVRHKTYALNYRDGQYELDLGRLTRALERYTKEPAPVRLIGYPSYACFLLRYLKEKGKCYSLPGGSLILLGGGWKQFGAQQVEKEELYRLFYEVLGIREAQIREFFGAVEHPALYCSCKNHHFHVPCWSRVVVRDTATLEPLGYGKAGLMEFITPAAKSMPLTAVMTDDLGILHEGKECGCGILAPYFEVIKRAGLEEIRTCAAGAEALLGEEAGA